MAVSLVGTGGGSAINGGNVTATFTANGIAGDVVYAAVTTSGTAPTVGSGYTEIASSAAGASSTLRIYRKILTATESSVVVTGNASTSAVTAVSAFVVRGADNSVPEDIISAAATGSSTNPNPPSVTTLTRGTRAIVFAGSQVNDTAVTAPTGYGNLAGASASDTVPGSCWGAFRSTDIEAPATAEDPATFTAWTTGGWASFTIILRQSISNLYWVGGTGTWSSTNVGNWASTSNGSAGYIGYIPSAATNVFFDGSSESGSGASGPFTVTVSTGAVCKNLTASGLYQTMTLAGSDAMSIYGNLSVPATLFTQSYTGTITFASTGSQTITTNSKTFTAFTFDGVGGTWTLQDALTLTGAATLTNGTLALGVYTFTCSTFSSSNSNARTISFGTGKIVVTSAATTTVWNSTTVTNFTTSGTTLVELTGGGATNKTVVAGAFTEANAINFTLLTTAGGVVFGGSVKNLIIPNNSFTFYINNTTLYGNLTILGSSPTITVNTGSAEFIFAATSGTKTITTNGATIDTGITFDGAGGTFALAGALTIGTTVARVVNHTNGIVDYNGYTVTLYGYWYLSQGAYAVTRQLINTGGGSNKLILTILADASTQVFNHNDLRSYSTDGNINVQITGTGLFYTGPSGYTLNNTLNWQVSSTSGTVIFGNSSFPCAFKNLTIDNNSVTVNFLGASNSIIILGNYTVGGTSPTISVTGNYLFAGTSGTSTINLNGHNSNTIPVPITFNGVGGTFQLLHNLTSTGAATLTNGTLSLDSYTFSCDTFSSSNANARTINFGTGKIVVTSAAAATVWTTTTITNLTISGTSLVQLTGAGATTKTISAGALSEANAISFQISNTAGTVTFTASNTVKNLTIDNNSVTVSNIALTIYGNLSIGGTSPTLTAGTNTWTFAATSGTKTITTNGAVINFPITFNGVGGTWALQDALTIGDGITSRTVTLTAGTLELNSYTFTLFGVFSSSNSNTRRIQMSGSGGKIVLVVVSATSLWGSATVTNMTTDGNVLVQVTGGGVTSNSINPGQLSEANAMSFQLSRTSGTISFNTSDRVKNLTIDNNSFTVSNIQITIYGNLIVGGTTVTLTAGANAWTFAATSGTKTITTNGATLDFPIIFNGVGGTWQLQDALTIGAGVTARQLTLTNGTLDLNAYTLTMFGNFSSSNSNIRTVNFGTGKIVLAMAGATTTTILDTSTSTNLTSIGSTPIEVVGAGTLTRTISTSAASVVSATFNFSILTTAGIVANSGRYNNLTYNCTNTTVSGSPSLFGNLTMVTTVTSSSSGTTTMIGSSGTITSNGNTIVFPITIDTVGGTTTLNDALTLDITNSTNGALTLTNGTLNLNNFTATLNRFSSTNTNTRSIAFGTSGKILVRGTNDNTNSAIYMDTMGGFSFSGTSNIEANITTAAVTQRIRMGITSGATVSNIMNFTLTGTLGTQQLLGSFNDITLNTDAIFTTNTTALCYGNFNHIKVSLTASSGSVTFASTSGTKTITSNGQTILYPIIFDGVGGTWQLQDALSVGNAASVTVTLTNGTLDLNSYTMTIFGIFSSSNSNTRRIQTTGSGGKIVLSLNTATTVWSTPTVTNMTTDGNILVQLTGGGAVVKTISAGALSEANSISFQLSNTAGTATFTASNTVKNLTIDNNSFTVSNIAFTIYGNLLIGGTTVTLTAGTNIWTFSATSGTKTITTNGATLVFPLTFNGVGGTWALQDALTMNSSRVITLTNGTFNLNNYTCTAAGGFTVTGSGSKVLAHGTGDLVISLAGSNAFNGSDLGITDGSAAPVTITNNGAAGYDDATPFVGASNSIFFNGTSQYLSVPANNAFLFDAGNFTIEAWIRPTSAAGAPGIANTWQIGGAWGFSLTTSRYLRFLFTNISSGVGNVSLTGTTQQVTLNSWNHVAVVRNGNTITSYVNGVADATTLSVTGMTMYYYNGGAKDLKIGVGADTAGYFPGQISNFRIVKGTAVYTTNFTPSTSPLTAVSGTSILVQQNHISAGTLTSTGTGKIDMTSATAKTFSGGNNSYATLNQGGAGTLTIRGTNTFQNITNSVQPANVSFTDNTTQTFTNDFNLNGTSGNLITIGSVTPASTFTLSKSSGTVDVSFCSISDSIATGGASWQSYTSNGNVDGGNNTGWLFTAIVLATGSFLLLF